MAKALEYNATLVERVDLTEALSIFRVRPDDGVDWGDSPTKAEDDPSWFIPGQFMVLGMNNEDEPELGKVQRPMSIASAPQESNYIEFYIRYVSKPTSKNPLTHLLWKLRNGDRMFVRTKAKGHFTLQKLVPNIEEESRQIVLVSAGTGLAPFLSIARDFINRGRTDLLKKVAILHGASYPRELGFKAQLENLCNKYGLRYMGTISRAHEVPVYDGATGRVEEHFEGEKLEALEGLLGLKAGEFTPDNALVFICGLQGTIGKTIEHLAARGFIPDNVKLRKAFNIAEESAPSLFFEQYDSEPVIDLNNEELVARIRKQLGSD